MLFLCVGVWWRWKCGVSVLADSLRRLTPRITQNTVIWQTCVKRTTTEKHIHISFTKIKSQIPQDLRTVCMCDCMCVCLFLLFPPIRQSLAFLCYYIASKLSNYSDTKLFILLFTIYSINCPFVAKTRWPLFSTLSWILTVFLFPPDLIFCIPPLPLSSCTTLLQREKETERKGQGDCSVQDILFSL